MTTGQNGQQGTDAGGTVQPGMTLRSGTRTFTVDAPIARNGMRRFFRAKDDTGTAFTVVEEEWPLGNASVLASVRDDRLLRPIHSMPTGTGQGAIHVFPRPAAISVNEWISDASGAPDPKDVLTFGIRLCETIESIHGAGRVILSLDPELVLRTPQLDVVLVGLDDLPLPGTLARHITTSTAAPEVVHKLAPLCGITSDVYAVASIVHGLLAKRPFWTPPTGVSSVVAHQFSPRTWRPELPMGIWPRLAPALDPDPARRVPHLAALKELLKRALHMITMRTVQNARPWKLDGWADSHIGVGKARRGGDQQDRLFCGVGQTTRMVLAAVADGVSHATLGDGGTAAEHTMVQVRRLFEDIHAGAAPDDGSAPLNDLLEKRHQMLWRIQEDATRAIAADANANHPPLKGDPAGVMASTIVAALVEDGMASVVNLGDSRAYLWDGETVESITIDHDRRTESVRHGMDPYQAVGLEAAGALTRAVGRSVVGPDGKLVAAPSTTDMFDIPMRPGDRLILCSDGLPDYATPLGKPVLSPVGIEEILGRIIRDAIDPAMAAHELIGLANRNGGHDNIAVVAVFVGAG